MKLEKDLRKFRFESGETTQQELANAVGVTGLTILSIETGSSTLLHFDVPFEAAFYLSKDKMAMKNLDRTLVNVNKILGFSFDRHISVCSVCSDQSAAKNTGH